MRKVIIFLMFLASAEANAQSFWIGPAFGGLMRNNTGTSVVSDSIVVYALGSRATMNVFSVFSELDLNNRFQLRGSVNFTTHLIGYGMYNRNSPCSLCRDGYVDKGADVMARSLNAAIIPQVKIKSFGEFRVFFFGGARANFNFLKEEEDTFLESRYPGLAETANALDEVIKPVYFNSILGVKAEWRRFALFFELDKNIGSTVTRPVKVYGNEYFLNTKTNTFNLQLGYRLVDLSQKEE